MVIRFNVSNVNQPIPSSFPFNNNRVFTAIIIKFTVQFVVNVQSLSKYLLLLSVQIKRVTFQYFNFETQICNQSYIIAFVESVNQTVLDFRNRPACTKSCGRPELRNVFCAF